MVAIVSGCVPREVHAEGRKSGASTIVAMVLGCVLSDVCTEEETV
jgi:uncharacterized membrane protein YraQ (UPF0718 family)